MHQMHMPELPAPRQPSLRALSRVSRTGRLALRHWPLWLALAIGAFLRLWHVDSAMFLADQSNMMTLAREAVTLHALPVTGIPSSIGTLNPPFSIYLLVPFAALATSPWPAVVALALWNIAGIGVTYVFALRHFGRVVAAVSALLLATCGAAVDYSRYLWQQNYLAPFLALFGLALFSWCVRGQRGWLPLAVLTLTAATLLHPTGVLLLPVLAVAALLAPVRPSRWEWGVSAAGVALLLAPTALWEVLTNGSDLQALSAMMHAPAHVDVSSLASLYEVLGRPGTVTGFPVAPDGTLTALWQLVSQPPHTIFSADALYSWLGWGDTVIPAVAVGVFLLGWLVVTARVVEPLVSALWQRWRRRGGRTAATDQGAVPRARGFRWQRLRGSAAWRAHVLLWLWVTIPPLALVRHTSPVYAHYLIIVYPAAFIVEAVGIAWILLRVGALGVLLAHLARLVDRGALVGSLVPRVAIALLAALLMLGQATQSALFVASLRMAQFAGESWDSMPLYAQRSAIEALGRLQRQLGARSVFVLTSPARDAALTYTLVTDQPQRVRVPDDCLILPAPAESPALVVSADAGSNAAQLVAHLPTATHVADIPLPGGQPLQVFRVTAPAGAAAGAQSSQPTTFGDGSRPVLSLQDVTHGASVVELRWSVLTTIPTGLTQTSFRMSFTRQSGGAQGAAGAVTCQATRWQAGETLYTWLPTTTSGAAGAPHAVATVGVQEQVTAPGLRQVGAVRVLGFSNDIVRAVALVPGG